MPMGEEDPIFTLKYLNRRCVIPFRDCVAGLLDEEPVACLITDAGFYFTQAVADDLKLPQLVLWTSSLACILVYGSYPLFCQKGYIDLPDSNSDTRAAGYSPLKEKDITKIATNKDGMEDFIISMFKQMKASSGIIFNTFKELEEPAQEKIYQDFPVPNFTLGPFHKYFSVSTSSLIEQDRTILPWLDNQLPKSTIYVSFGSEACLTESEFQQVAHTLANVGYPFVWVVRPGFVTGCEWVESLPDKLLERLRERGHIVKWCPQQEVLAHPATGCFWTHNGWNSTLESICEGVPMICSPFSFDQPINARYVTDVWESGILLEDGFEQGGMEMAIKRVMMGKEGEEMRKGITSLKEKVNLSVNEGGSSHKSLESLVSYISLF